MIFYYNIWAIMNNIKEIISCTLPRFYLACLIRAITMNNNLLSKKSDHKLLVSMQKHCSNNFINKNPWSDHYHLFYELVEWMIFEIVDFIFHELTKFLKSISMSVYTFTQAIIHCPKSFSKELCVIFLLSTTSFSILFFLNFSISFQSF